MRDEDLSSYAFHRVRAHDRPTISSTLMVYGPGGDTFADRARVGAPLQFVLTVVTTAGIAFSWGL